jgi:hypothetical protein
MCIATLRELGLCPMKCCHSPLRGFHDWSIPLDHSFHIRWRRRELHRRSPIGFLAYLYVSLVHAMERQSPQAILIALFRFIGQLRGVVIQYLAYCGTPRAVLKEPGDRLEGNASMRSLCRLNPSAHMI